MLPPSSPERDWVSRVERLSSLNQVHRQILGLIDQDAAATQLAQAIEGDAALLVRVLQLANAPNKKLKNKVTSAARATMVLGMAELRRHVQTASLIGNLDRLCGERFEPLWEHASAVAMLGERIAYRLQGSNPDVIFIAGMLHDFGQLLMYEAEHATYKQLWDSTKGAVSGAELAAFGIDHSLVGYLLVRRWGLEDLVAQVVLHHHAPGNADSYPTACLMVHLADVLADALGLGRESAHPRVPELQFARSTWKDLNLDMADLGPIMMSTLRNFQHLRGVLPTAKDHGLTKAAQELEPGDRVTVDLHSDAGTLLLPAGTKLSGAMIGRLKAQGVPLVQIEPRHQALMSERIEYLLVTLDERFEDAPRGQRKLKEVVRGSLEAYKAEVEEAEAEAHAHEAAQAQG